MANVKIVVNRKAIRDILKSDRVRQDLEERAARIAAAAGPGHTADSYVGANRARATVFTETFEARHAEATTRNLTSAVDAGRG